MLLEIYSLRAFLCFSSWNFSLQKLICSLTRSTHDTTRFDSVWDLCWTRKSISLSPCKLYPTRCAFLKFSVWAKFVEIFFNLKNDARMRTVTQLPVVSAALVDPGVELLEELWLSLLLTRVIAVNTSPGGSGLRCSCICCRRSATCAAKTLCRSAINKHFGHRQSLHRQNPLCPFKIESKPWFRHRAHFGVRFFSAAAACACLLAALLLVATEEPAVVVKLPLPCE